MDAVEGLTRTQGIDRISMTDLANAAGITRTALYNYFPDKPALLLAFTEQVNSAFVERYKRELPSGVSAARRLSAFVRLQLEGLVAHPHPPAAELGASLGPDAYQALAAHVAPMQRLLTEIVEEGTAGGEFDRLPAERVAGLTLSMVGSQRLPLVNGEIEMSAAQAPYTAAYCAVELLAEAHEARHAWRRRPDRQLDSRSVVAQEARHVHEENLGRAAPFHRLLAERPDPGGKVHRYHRAPGEEPRKQQHAADPSTHGGSIPEGQRQPARGRRAEVPPRAARQKTWQCPVKSARFRSRQRFDTHCWATDSLETAAPT